MLNTEASLRQSRGCESSSSATPEMRGWGQGPRRYLNINKTPTKIHQNTISSPPREGVSELIILSQSPLSWDRPAPGCRSRLAVEEGQEGQESPSLTVLPPRGRHVRHGPREACEPRAGDLFIARPPPQPPPPPFPYILGRAGSRT